MRRRLLLLGVGIASLGAIFASAVLANPTSSSPTTGSGNVSVQAISGLSVSLASTDTIIVANDVAQKIADVMAGETDADYEIAAIGIAVTNQGSTTGTCTAVVADRYTVSPAGAFNIELDPDVANNTDVGDLLLTLPVTVGNDCVVSGGVVTVSFQAQ